MPLVPAATAPDAGQVAREELQWYRENPEPKSTPTLEALTENDDTLTLELPGREGRPGPGP